MPDKTLFQRIADRELPADIVHEDDRCLAFRDVHPQAPTHVLIVPRRPIPGIQSVEPADAELIGHLFVTARALAEQLGLDGGYRLVFNVGEDGGQTVPHLHLHLLGGRPLSWPPG
jgi:histidine triad (HIT) family protein